MSFSSYEVLSPRIHLSLSLCAPIPSFYFHVSFLSIVIIPAVMCCTPLLMLILLLSIIR